MRPILKFYIVTLIVFLMGWFTTISLIFFSNEKIERNAVLKAYDLNGEENLNLILVSYVVKFSLKSSSFQDATTSECYRNLAAFIDRGGIVNDPNVQYVFTLIDERDADVPTVLNLAQRQYENVVISKVMQNVPAIHSQLLRSYLQKKRTNTFILLDCGNKSSPIAHFFLQQ